MDRKLPGTQSALQALNQPQVQLEYAASYSGVGKSYSGVGKSYSGVGKS